ncbi:MAG: error-prone DNA polymerase, partial [Chromatiaceae bacterium]
RALAAADALAGLAGDRHQAAWQVARREPARPLLPVGNAEPSLPLLTAPTEGANIVADYASLGLTLRRHPLALLRARLAALGLLSAAAVAATAPGRLVHGAGLVINRQRPAAANQVTFVTLEDETGQLNLVVWQQVAARHRATLLGARLLGVSGRVQRTAGVTQLLATELTDYSDLLGALLVRARDFR